MLSSLAEPMDPARSVPPVRQAAPRARVLLALQQHEYPAESLQRAESVVRAMNADLHLLRVLPAHSRAAIAWGSFGPEDARQEVYTLRDERAAITRWAADSLPAALGPERIALCRGDFVTSIVDHAKAIGASLIILAPSVQRSPKAVELLADTSALPVLVAHRSSQPHAAILAATDLRDAAYPVLRRAMALGDLLQAPVVPLHNVSPLAAVIGHAVRHPSSLREFRTLYGELQLQQKLRLGDARAHLKLERGVVCNAERTVDAILEQARAHDAELVVVGLRRRSWLDRKVGVSVAAQVVARARRSVLVSPMGRAQA